jgi:hypothetical protein
MSLLDALETKPATSAVEATQRMDQVRPEGQLGAAAQARKAQEEARKVDENTTGRELIGAAMTQGFLGAVHRTFMESQVDEEDPEWSTRPTDWTKYADERGVSRDQLPLLARAVSQKHLDLLTSLAVENTMAAETQSHFGIMANMGASMLDPVGASLDFATGGLAWSAKAGRLINAARAGTVAATTAAAGTAASSHFNPVIGTEEVVTAAALSFALGGTIGARQGSEVAAARALEVAKKDHSGSSQSMGAARVDGLTENRMPGFQERTLDEFEEEHVARGVDGAAIRPAFAKVRMSLAATMGNLTEAPTARAVSRWLFRDGVGHNDRTSVVEISAGEESHATFKPWQSRIASASQSGWGEFAQRTGLSSWDNAARDAFEERVAMFMRGGAPDEKDAAVKAVASEYRQVLDEAHALKVRAGIAEQGTKAEDYFPQHQSAQAYTRLLGDDGFSEEQLVEVYRGSILSRMRHETNADGQKASDYAKFKEAEELYEGTSAKAKGAREKAERTNARISELQTKLEGAEARLLEVKDMPGAAGARSRTAAERKVAELTKRLMAETDTMKRRKADLEAALKKEADSGHTTKIAKQMFDDGGVSEELADAFARALVARGKKNLLGSEEGSGIRALDTGDLEQVRELLEEAGVSAEKMKHLLHNLGERTKEASALGSSKKRIRIDPNHKVVLTNRFGKSREVSVQEMLSNNAARVVDSHIREAAGWAAMAKRGNVRNPSELRRLRELLAKEARQSKNDADKVTRMFDIGVSNVFGRSAEKNANSTYARAGRALRDTQFLRLMNQVGFSQFTEFGPVIAHSGLKNVTSSVWSLRDLLKRGADGKLDNKFARFQEELFAPGTDFLRGGQAFMRHEDDGLAPSAWGDSKAGKMMDNATHYAQRFTSVASGMAPLNAAMQRIAGRAHLMKLMELAKSKKPLSAAQLQRLRGGGLDEKTQEALFGYLRTLKTVDDIAEEGLELTEREILRTYMYRATRHMVLEGDASDSLMLQHSTLGKILTQFRSFMAYSYERHFLNSLYHWKDWNTYSMVTLSTFIAGMQWMARTYVNTIGDEEQRKKLMTNENFVKGAIGQASWSGVVPALVDTSLGVAGEDALFSNTRSTGLSNNLLGGVPAVDFANRLAGATSLPGQILNPDKEVDKREMENFTKLFWFSNLTGWRNIQNQILKSSVNNGVIVEKSEVEAKAAREAKEEDKQSWGAKRLFGID